MWPIHSCDMIGDRVCVVDTTIFKIQVGSDKNKHELVFLSGTGSQGRMGFVF